MTRDQGTGDWAAWMATPAPGAPRPAAATGSPSAGQSDATEPPNAAARETEAPATAPETPPVVSPPTEQVVSPVTDGVTDAAARPSTGPDVADADPEGPSGHRSARREATRQRLLDAARAVFAERGVAGGSVEDICERAGFTRGAFYSNFDDKDEVVTALMEREQARVLEHLDTSLELVWPEIAAADALSDVLHSIVDRILRTVPVDRQLMLIQTELEIHAIRRPDLSRQLLEVGWQFRQRLGSFIEEAMARNGRELVVSPGDVVDTAIAIAERSVRRGLLAGSQDLDELAAAVLPGVLLALSRPAERTRS